MSSIVLKYVLKTKPEPCEAYFKFSFTFMTNTSYSLSHDYGYSLQWPAHLARLFLKCNNYFPSGPASAPIPYEAASL